MAMNWTKNQQKALNAKAGKYLVAAGAGSGKTAVLTNRINQLIFDSSLGISFSNLLVLTFTKKAAADMKNKTRKILLESEEGKKLLPELEAASITTFDSFALGVVKKYHYELGLPKHVEILDEGLEKLQKQRILDEILNEKYQEALDNPKGAFAHLAKNLAFKDDKELRALILKIDAAADLEEDRDLFFSSYKAKHYDDRSFIEGAWKNLVNEAVEALSKALEIVLDAGSAIENEKDVNFLNDKLALFRQDEAVFWKQLADDNFPRPSKSWSPEYASIHSSVNENYYKAAHAIAKSFPSKEAQIACYLATEADVMEVLSLAKLLGEKMKEFSYSHHCFTFAGIATLAREVVKKHPEVQKQMHDQYRYIMIDEYQDTNDLQESFMNSLKSENVFQVGDVKQSIYGFRNANPTLFENKRLSYGKPGGEGELITLADNFRSREPILIGINDLFLELMDQKAGGVDYKDNQALLFGNHSYTAEQGEEHKPAIATYEPVDRLSKGELEARSIAGDIAKKIAERFLVQDEKGLRPCTYKDFCILVDKRTDLDAYRRVFNDLKIPFEAVEKGESSKKDITLVFRNLLELILVLQGEIPSSENRLKHLYASLGRSFLCHEKDKVIFEAIQNGSYRDSPLFKKANEVGEKIRGLGLEEAVGEIFKDFEFVERLPLLAEVKENYATIERFQKLSATFAGFGWGLPSFFAYFSDIEKYEQQFNIEPSSSGMDCVHYMTIHASKGLEFPFVYVGGLHHPFFANNPNSGEKQTATYHPTYGVLLSRIGEEGDDTLMSFLFLKAKEEERQLQISERMRLFYVALTRAKEYLYLVRPPKKERKKGPKKPWEAGKSTDFLDAYENKNHAFLEENWAPSFSVSNLPESVTKKPAISLHEIHVEAIEVEPLQKASKAKTEKIPEQILLEGTRLHRLLELMDWHAKDVSWIKNDKDRAIIDKVVALPLFENSQQAKAFQEYSFVDEEEGVNGTIDLFLLYEDHIDLIDYKTRSIDDPSYGEQLAVYEAYLSKVFHLPIRKYLLSIKESRLKVID